MALTDMTINEFSAALASDRAMPGGGGAAALCGSLAAALGSMVGNITMKSGAAPQLVELTRKSEKLRRELTALIDGDAEAFAALSAVYKLPKDEPSRAQQLECCLEAAASAPMRILELCCETIELMECFAACGKPAVVSDAGTGVVLAWGAMYAAALNVRVNTRMMKGKDKAAQMNGRVQALMDEYWQRADRVYEDVYQRLS